MLDFGLFYFALSFRGNSQNFWCESLLLQKLSVKNLEGGGKYLLLNVYEVKKDLNLWKDPTYKKQFFLISPKHFLFGQTFPVSVSYYLSENQSVYKKVKSVYTSKSSYKMRLFQNFQCLVYLKYTFLNVGSRCMSRLTIYMEEKSYIAM